jgi:hypothetical protein
MRFSPTLKKEKNLKDSDPLDYGDDDRDDARHKFIHKSLRGKKNGIRPTRIFQRYRTETFSYFANSCFHIGQMESF